MPSADHTTSSSCAGEVIWRSGVSSTMKVRSVDGARGALSLVVHLQREGAGDRVVIELELAGPGARAHRRVGNAGRRIAARDVGLHIQTGGRVGARDGESFPERNDDRVALVDGGCRRVEAEGARIGVRALEDADVLESRAEGHRAGPRSELGVDPGAQGIGRARAVVDDVDRLGVVEVGRGAFERVRGGRPDARRPLRRRRAAEVDDGIGVGDDGAAEHEGAGECHEGCETGSETAATRHRGVLRICGAPAQESRTCHISGV